MIYNDKVQYFSPNDKPYGKTWEDWSRLWWQWLSSNPKDRNPVYSNDMSIGNNDPNVYFLAGGLNPPGVYRHLQNEFNVIIPNHKAVFFPTVNIIMSLAENKTLKTDQDLVDYVTHDQDDITIKHMRLDDIILDGHRVAIKPFDLQLPPNNIYDTEGCVTRAAGDGFWVFMHPLPRGQQYRLFTSGACSQGRTSVYATYNITVK
jgi:hypothetical protein